MHTPDQPNGIDPTRLAALEARVVERGTRLRQRYRRARVARRLALVGAGCLIVVAAVVVRPGASPAEHVATDGVADDGATTTSSTVTILEPSVGTTITTPERTTSTTAPSRPGTTTTTAAPVVRCAADDFTVTVALPKQAFAAGEPVPYTSVVRNRSTRRCAAPAVTGVCIVRVDTGDGECRSIDDMRPEGGGAVVEPGQEARYEDAWGQRGCGYDPGQPGSCGQVPPGEYRLTVAWSDAGKADTTFTVH